MVGEWAAAGMVGQTGVDWWRESPGGLGGVFLLSRGVKLAKSSEPSHFGLPVTKLNMEQLYLCDADSLYINRTTIVNLGSYWRQSTNHTKLEESLPSRLA